MSLTCNCNCSFPSTWGSGVLGMAHLHARWAKWSYFLLPFNIQLSRFFSGWSGLQQNGSTCQCWWLCWIGGARYCLTLGFHNCLTLEFEIAYRCKKSTHVRWGFKFQHETDPPASWVGPPGWPGEWFFRVNCFRSPGRKWWTTCFVTFTTSVSASQLWLSSCGGVGVMGAKL